MKEEPTETEKNSMDGATPTTDFIRQAVQGGFADKPI